MAEEPKKISFGFSKTTKKPAVVLKPKKEENEIQFIDSVEDNSIKLVKVEEEKGPLVIPLKNANILRDSMIETLKQRREERKTGEKKDILNGKADEKKDTPNSNVEEKPLTLDELAAKEILEDLKNKPEEENTSNTREIPTSNINSLGEKESTLDDYENVPVQEFGLAVLRGMGWAPEKGIGKNGKIVEPVNPILRPKGMGLGADKVMTTVTVTNSKEELVMKKNAMLKIVNGPYKNLYGKVEGFDELPGRLMVRLTLQNTVISISENLVQLVPSGEYNKNCKILNLNDYNDFQDNKDASEGRNKIIKDKTEVIDSYDQQKYKKEKRRSPSSKRYTERIKRRSPSPDTNGEERYIKSRKIKPRSVSPNSDYENNTRKEGKQKGSSHSEERYKKSKKGNYRSPSLDSDDKSRKSKKDKNRNSSTDSESDDRYKKIKSRKVRNRSPSESSEEDMRSRKSRKKGRRNSSTSSESDEHHKKYRKYIDKKRNQAYNSDDDIMKQKSRKARSTSEERNIKDNHKKNKKIISVSSDSESDMKRKKHEKRLKKHSRKDVSDSDSAPERSSKYKKHSNIKTRSRSRSPKKKKKKKHYRSSS